MAETIEHWKRWISKEPLRLLSRIVGEVSCLHSCKPPSGGSVGQSGPNTTPGHRADAGIGRGWASPGWNAASTAYGLLPSRWRSRRRICGASLSFKERVTRSPSNVPSLKYQSAPGKMHRAGAWFELAGRAADAAPDLVAFLTTASRGAAAITIVYRLYGER
jgi:hypothetical protein